MDPEFQDIERQLASMKPAPLSDDLLARLEAVATRVPVVQKISEENNVVPFPGKHSQESKRESHRPAWAAAAAVAILGAMTALMLPNGTKSGASSPVAANLPKKETSAAPTISRVPMSANPAIVPAALGASVESAQDRGVTTGPNGEPMRMMRVIYRDKVRVPTADGKWLVIEQPREEVILVPEKFQ